MDGSCNYEAIRQRFFFLKGKKLLVYGSGKNAVLLIKALCGFNLVGVIDRVLFEGDVGEVPILTWDDIGRDTADALIIASALRNYREIFLRIQHYGAMYGLDMYNFLGMELTGQHYYDSYTYDEMAILENTKQGLMDKIDGYEAVSFDLFDTLVMRRVLEPADIFDIVERKLHAKGIYIKDFKKKRRTAEIASKGGDIHSIYRELKKRLGIPDEEAALAMEEELNCEKENIVPRKPIAEVMEYAKSRGKTVSIISNMYLTSPMVREMLDGVGIQSYDKIYISCEYGAAKSNGLFEAYKMDVGGKRCLHIGDDAVEDVLGAERNGISAYGIKSPVEMLKMSRMRGILLCSRGFANRHVLGRAVEGLFNDPFCLSGMGGFVPVTSRKAFAMAFIAPVAWVYMQGLLRHLSECQYDGVIFPARDGFLFYHLYEKCRNHKPGYPEGVYLTISRKVAMAISQFDGISQNARRYENGANAGWFWHNIMGFQNTERSGILEESAAKRGAYIGYMEKSGIDMSKKYLFCDLISAGTTQSSLGSLFGEGLHGFYLLIHPDAYLRGVNRRVSAVYGAMRENAIMARTDMLEAVLTAPQPSAKSIDGSGAISFEEEERTQEDICMAMGMQHDIEGSMDDFIMLWDCNEMVDSSLPEILLASIDGAVLCGGMAGFSKRETVDTMDGKRFSIMRRI